MTRSGCRCARQAQGGLPCTESPAGVAQSAEQPSCKRQVSGSNPLTGSQLRPDPSASMPGRNRHSAAKSAAKASGWPVIRRSPSRQRRSPRARSPGAHGCRCSSSGRSGCGRASSSLSAANDGWLLVLPYVQCSAFGDDAPLLGPLTLHACSFRGPVTGASTYMSGSEPQASWRFR